MGVKNYRVIRYIVLLAAVALIAYGVATGEYSGVLNKATRICYECIGIG